MSKVRNFHTAEEIAARFGISIDDAVEIVRYKNVCKMSRSKPKPRTKEEWIAWLKNKKGSQDKIIRQCRKCGNKIPSKTIIDGKERILSSRKYCLDCSPFGAGNRKSNIDKPPSIYKTNGKSNGKQVTKYRKNLKQKLMNYKGGKCEICGYDKPIPCVYDFHHKNKSEKSYSISTNLCKSYADLIKEVDKCLLLCKNCHYEKHHNENWAQMVLKSSNLLA